MTVSQLTQELTMEEVIGWSAYFAIKADEDDKERDRVQSSAASRVQTR